MMSSIKICRIGCFLLLAVLSGYVFAETSAGIKGTVSDMTGAVIPGAEIVICRVGEAGEPIAKKKIVTDSDGHFSLDLSPGQYHLVLTRLGFKQITEELKIRSGERLEFSKTMEVQATPDDFPDLAGAIQTTTSDVPDQIPFSPRKKKK